jgi:hypothetical protein
MNLINNIKNIKKFIVYKNKILTINNNNVFSDQAKNIQLFDSPVNGFIQFNNKIYINDWSGKYFILDANLNILENGDGKGFYFSSSNYFGCQYLNEFGLNEALIDKNSKAIEFGILNKDSSLNYSTQSFFYFIKENYLHSYSLPSATSLWQFDLGSLGAYKPIYGTVDERKSYQVSKFLGVWQNQLLVACDGGLILCLSTESGAVLRKWDTLPNSAEEDLKDVFRGYLHQSGNVFQLSKAGNKIIGLYYCHWVEICLETGNITTKHLKDAFDKHSISSFQTKSGYAEDETHWYSTLFFDQQKLGLNYMPTAICALNKQTNEIDWFYRFDIDTSGDYVSVQVPQVSNGKLYQLTQNNVLHIFEKE